ncbi:MAG: hypothetical protein JXR70_11445 [Spirochaetales bacterium]|nr:hypothetical protein [Spirochaetales bacterium]
MKRMVLLVKLLAIGTLVLLISGCIFEPDTPPKEEWEFGSYEYFSNTSNLYLRFPETKIIQGLHYYTDINRSAAVDFNDLIKFQSGSVFEDVSFYNESILLENITPPLVSGDIVTFDTETPFYEFYSGETIHCTAEVTFKTKSMTITF